MAKQQPECLVRGLRPDGTGYIHWYTEGTEAVAAIGAARNPWLPEITRDAVR